MHPRGYYIINNVFRPTFDLKNPQKFQFKKYRKIDLGEPTHTIVPCWMPKLLPPRNKCTDCFAPAPQNCNPFDFYPPTSCKFAQPYTGAYLSRSDAWSLKWSVMDASTLLSRVLMSSKCLCSKIVGLHNQITVLPLPVYVSIPNELKQWNHEELLFWSLQPSLSYNSRKFLFVLAMDRVRIWGHTEESLELFRPHNSILQVYTFAWFEDPFVTCVTIGTCWLELR